MGARAWLLRARESFWFLPTLFGVAAVALALGLVEVDRALIGAGVTRIPLIEDLSATGGRAVLSAIGGTMLGVAATSFSITISVLATTTSAYGPRLVRNFMADRGNQLVLAVLTSTFLYALIVLRAIHTEEDSSFAFVPVIAVSFAVILAVGDVAVLVYFIHHIALSVQVSTLQQRVSAELDSVIDLLYPEAPAEAHTAAPVRGGLGLLPTPAVLVRAESTGYVQQVQLSTLIARGARLGEVYRIVAVPGEYVLSGDVIAEVHRTGTDPGDAPEDAAAVAAAFTIAAARTPHQDIRFAVQQVIEIGVRGLASGTNDPYTAVSAIDALGGALATLCTRPAAAMARTDDDDVVRVVVVWPRAEELIGDLYLAVRTYGLEHPLVVQAMVRVTRRLETVARGRVRTTLQAEVDGFVAALRASAPVTPVAAVQGLEELSGRLTASPTG